MPLWNNLSMLIYRKNAKRIGFNDCNTIETPLSNENRIINFLILYAKQYLFICVKENNVLNFTGLMFHLKLGTILRKVFLFKIVKSLSLRSFGFHGIIFFILFCFCFCLFLLFLFVIFTKISSNTTLLKYNIYKYKRGHMCVWV